MTDMPEWAESNVEILRQIPLGVLRKNATQRHGVTRWKRGVNLASLAPEDVEVIDLHPRMLEDDWKAYSAFVLHHEYIHALGLREHNSLFRKLESAWPAPKASGQGKILQNFCEDKGQNGYGIVQHVELSILAKSVLVDVTDAGLATRSSLTEKIQMPC